MGTSTKSWEDTKLWFYLKNKGTDEGEEAIKTVKRFLPDIETILQSAGTQPKDFTLHDQAHGFRVAQRMVEVVGEDVVRRLGTYELALLLMSAYLHDIGMAPEFGKLAALEQILMTKDEVEEKALSIADQKHFRHWLLDQGENELPICQGQPSSKVLAKISRLMAYYCRSKHNDWSGEYIDVHLSPYGWPGYDAWASDLKKLCMSHHSGREELEKKIFEAKPVGDEIVNLRYLAAVLRIADVMEVDPERTPDVILAHRAVDEKSVAHWIKDQVMTVKVYAPNPEDKTTLKVDVSAEPREAYVHKAVLEAAKWIDQELELCRTLDDDNKFAVGVHDDDTKTRYVWPLTGSSLISITPRDDRYAYIDGSFRPNTQKILQLLSGIELYGDSKVAVRELMQNAFDAVRWKIARQRLSHPKGETVKAEKTIGAMYGVRLGLEQDAERLWLVCEDDGIGMSQKILKDRFLVSGISGGADQMELENACQEKGFSAEITGQFGIGVLSYFMLSDHLILHTRPSAEVLGETEGWEFETYGIGDFGELRSRGRKKEGTDIRLALKEELYTHPDDKTEAEKQQRRNAWFKGLFEDIRETLVRVPCRVDLDFSACVPDAQMTLEPGWARSREQIQEDALENFGVRDRHRYDGDIISRAVMDSRAKEEGEWVALKGQASQFLQWKEVEGTLNGGKVRYRVHIPYFAYDNGNALCFLGSELGEKPFVSSGSGTYGAWKGMRTGIMSPRDHEHSWLNLGISELDFVHRDAGRTSVNRNQTIIGEGFRHDLMQELREVLARALMDTDLALFEGPFSLINRAVVFTDEKMMRDHVLPLPQECYWPTPHPTDDAFCRPFVKGIRYTSDDYGNNTDGTYSASLLLHGFNGPANSLEMGGGVGLEKLLWFRFVAPHSEPHFGYGCTFGGAPGALPRSALCQCAFPPDWGDVAFALLSWGPRLIANQAHVLAGHLKGMEDGYEWLQAHYDGSAEGLNKCQEYRPEELAWWFIGAITQQPQDYLPALEEESPGFLKDVFQRLGVEDGVSVYIEQSHYRGLAGYNTILPNGEIERRGPQLPRPVDPEWCLDLVGDEENEGNE